MKTFYKKFLGILVIGILFTSAQSYSTIVNITVGAGGGLSFTPASASAMVGDTIRWTWASGTHDVVSSTVPGGANSFNSGINSTGFVYTYKITQPGVYSYMCTLHFGMNGSITASPSGISQENNLLPGNFELKQNYPNPFNPETNIKFALPVNSRVKISVVNLAGQEVAKLVDNNLTAGNYSVDFNARGLNSGVYFYRITATGGEKEFTAARKMVLIK